MGCVNKTTCDLLPADIYSSEFLTRFYFFLSKDKTKQGDVINVKENTRQDYSKIARVRNFSNLM